MLPPSLLAGENAPFLDDKYLQWREDPAAVEPEWAALFASLDDEPANGVAHAAFPGADARSLFAGRGGTSAVDAARQAAVAQLINAWRVRGHLLATLDPLGRHELLDHPELGLAWHGLTDADLDAVVATGNLVGVGPQAPLRDVLAHLRAVYADALGVEYMNIDDPVQKRWVQEQVESLPGDPLFGHGEEERVLRKLSDAEAFEQMLHTRFPGTKRFSLEGGETLIPLLDRVISESARAGVREIVMGMAHRGRLNVLANTLEKPARRIVEEFEDSRGPVHGSGDVKYHLGYSSDVATVDGHTVHLSLTPNPSHLEAVNAVVEGRVRAKQDRVSDRERGLAMPLLLHGDAAFIGQGSVMECFQLSELAGYRTGGTVHVVVNNQIGFTTAPVEGRSTRYATDAARMMAIPILHVNGENPRAVAAAVRIAVAWRQRFHRDVVIDMFCYRKHGHNEGDEPSFTQPLMYEEIRRRPTPRAVYADHLVSTGTLTREDVERIYEESRQSFDARTAAPEVADTPVDRVQEPSAKADDPDRDLYDSLSAETDTVNRTEATEISPVKGRWETYTDGLISDEVATGVPRERLEALLTAANAVPAGFTPHAKVKRLVAQRLDVARGERPVDWAMGEQAAFASLVAEGFRVRLAGQDSGRGTFSQRHAVWSDVRTGAEHYPLQHIAPDQARCDVIDSSLSEFAVLGFEYGYSLDTPDGLVLWEAQFGDFVNGAQVILDQFITSAEQKWGRLSGLVMLLPHGFEGQGPEHSSARLERFLLQCAQDNIQVANCSTPANYFHILRRQVVRHVRKPLVLMTPKSLLRHAACVSSLDDLATGGFQRVIPDPSAPSARSTRKVILCSGHVYYDLRAAMDADPAAAKGIALHRVELLYPFPGPEVVALLKGVPAKAEVLWVQEEPRNMGAWPAVHEWLRDALPAGRTLRYVGRPAAASPATGSHSQHKREVDAYLADALA